VQKWIFSDGLFLNEKKNRYTNISFTLLSLHNYWNGHIFYKKKTLLLTFSPEEKQLIAQRG